MKQDEQTVLQVCNDALHTAAAGKQTSMAAGGNRVENEASLLTDG